MSLFSDRPRPVSRKISEVGVKNTHCLSDKGASLRILANERQFFERSGRSLDFFCFVFCVKAKNEVGLQGQSPLK